MSRPPRTLHLGRHDRRELERWLIDAHMPVQMVRRARIVLSAADGMTTRQISDRVGCSEPTVVCWRQRFDDLGIRGLRTSEHQPLAGHAGKSTLQELILAASVGASASGAVGPAPSTRTVANQLRRTDGLIVSHDTVARLWRTHNLQRDRSGSVVFRTEPALVARVRDVLGMHLDLPIKAMVLCQDDHRPVTSAVRSGTTCLDTALRAYATESMGNVVPHRHGARLTSFLTRLCDSYADRELHLVTTPLPAECQDDVEGWIARRGPRVRLYQAPDAPSWLSIARASFAAVVAQAPQNIWCTPVADLIRAVDDLSREWQPAQLPLSWVKTPDAALNRARARAVTHN